MIIRSRAPLRLGFAGGGTDLSAFSDKYGGVVFNSTICMYSYCTIIPTNDNTIEIISHDNETTFKCESTGFLDPSDHNLILCKGVYNRIVRDFNNGQPLSFIMTTSNDAPIGSGLGTSSSMVVAILEAFDKLLKLNLTKYQKAHLAYDIERNDLQLAGGKQDQYAAVFGGFNFIEFKNNKQVIVNTLKINPSIIEELECSLSLFYIGKSRNSSVIIQNQINNTKEDNETTINAMLKLKENAVKMKDSITLGNFKDFSDNLNDAWKNKKMTSSFISNDEINNIVTLALDNGAESIKISGAGGGGILMIYSNPLNRHQLIKALQKIPGKVFPVKFTDSGVSSWTIE